MIFYTVIKTSVTFINTSTLLKSSGTIAIIEWQMIVNGNGPQLSHRISSQEITELLAKAGYQNILNTNIREDYYGLTATKP